MASIQLELKVGVYDFTLLRSFEMFRVAFWSFIWQAYFVLFELNPHHTQIET